MEGITKCIVSENEFSLAAAAEGVVSQPQLVTRGLACWTGASQGEDVDSQPELQCCDKLGSSQMESKGRAGHHIEPCSCTGKIEASQPCYLPHTVPIGNTLCHMGAQSLIDHVAHLLLGGPI